MNRETRFVSFASAFLVLATGLFIVPAQAIGTQGYRASFYCAAQGECLVGPNWVGGPLSEWFIGRGIVTFAGSGKFDQLTPNTQIPYPWYGTTSGILARGSVFASWGKQTICVVLYSNGEAGGLVVDEGVLTDCLAVGTAPGAGLLLYKGTYRDSTGTHVVSGKAGLQAGSNLGINIIQVNLYKPDNTPFFGIAWVETDISAGPISLHAANYFARYVKITTLS